jgi:hypothetical protein
MPDHDTDLRRAIELVTEAKRFVYGQKGKIIRLKTAGIDTSDAERTLLLLESNLKMFEEHRDALHRARHNPPQIGHGAARMIVTDAGPGIKARSATATPCRR